MANSRPLLRFVQLLPEAPSNGTFLLKDLPGSGKRIDLLCRDLAAAYDWGPNTYPPKTIEVIALLSDDTVLRFTNPGEDLPIGEKGWATEIRKALKGNPVHYIQVDKCSLHELLDELDSMKNNKTFILEEDGEDIKSVLTNKISPQNSFILGDHKGFDSTTLEILKNRRIYELSLGPISYLSSHCIAMVISEFERIIR